MKIITPLGLLCWAACGGVMAEDFTSFDADILRQRGVDPAISEILARKPKFLAGTYRVNIFINQHFKDKAQVEFNEQGEACFTADDLKSIGIALPFSLKNKAQCQPLFAYLDDAEIVYKPNLQELHFFVPERYLGESTSTEHFSYGGQAALLNYTANYLGNNNNVGLRNIYYINTEAGFNVENWSFRSTQLFNYFTHSEIRHQQAYAQTTLESLGQHIKIGQLNLMNLAGSAKVLGIQMTPEQSLSPQKNQQAIVAGTALEPSIVEVYQSGILIHNTAVPTGDFKLTDIQLLNRTSDLSVQVRGVNGAKHDFIVPASSFLAYSLQAESGMHVGFGRYDNERRDNHPLLLFLSKQWSISPRFTLLTAGMFSEDYMASGINSSILLPKKMILDVSHNASLNKNRDKLGALYSSALNIPLSPTLYLGANALIQEANYSYLDDAVNFAQNEYVPNKQKQFGGSIQWMQHSLGALNATFGKTFDAQKKSHEYLSLGWSKALYSRYLLSVNAQSSYSQDHQTDKSFYIRLNLPLDKANLSSSFNHGTRGDRISTRYSHYATRDRNWSISHDYDDRQNRQTLSGSYNMLTPYSQLSGSFRQDNQHHKDWGLSLSGGVGWTQAGLALSPYPIQETFAVAKLGQKKNIRIDSSAGSVWTNRKGVAIIPALQPYVQNAIKVDTRSLSRKTEIKNAFSIVTPARASIVPILFDIKDTRRVMLQIDITGQPLAENSSVFDEQGNFITLSMKNGKVLIADATDEMKLQIHPPDQQQCMATVQLAKHQKEDAVYEMGHATCVPIEE